MPRAGLEPASCEAEDFETSVYTIPPSGRGMRTDAEKRSKMVPRTGLEPVLSKEEDFKSSVSTIPPPGRSDILSIHLSKSKGKSSHFMVRL